EAVTQPGERDAVRAEREGLGMLYLRHQRSVGGLVRRPQARAVRVLEQRAKDGVALVHFAADGFELTRGLLDQLVRVGRAAAEFLEPTIVFRALIQKGDNL